jgi:hypothetical protein
LLGESGEALIGREADLLAPLTKGRHNYVPAAITAMVGKQCTVIAKVDQETYATDRGIVFLTVSKAQLITDSVTALGSSTHTSLAIADKAIVPPDYPKSTQSHLPEGCGSQTTPPKDIIEPTDADEEEVNSTPTWFSINKCSGMF